MMRSSLLLAALWACAPPCEDLAADLCADCPTAQQADCERVLGITQAAAVEPVCEAERDLFTCESLDG